MADTKAVMVTLSTPAPTKDNSKAVKKKEFEIAHANRILNVANTAWKLDDSKFKWNGKEIAKA